MHLFLFTCTFVKSKLFKEVLVFEIKTMETCRKFLFCKFISVNVTQMSLSLKLWIYLWIYLCLLEFKWGWRIEFHRPNRTCKSLITNERCSELHWFSIILPKAPNTIQLAFRCSTDALNSPRITPIGINGSTSNTAVQSVQCVDPAFFKNMLSGVTSKPTVWIWETLETVVCWSWFHRMIQCA